MKIGLVTITFNSGDVLPEFLKSVSEQKYSDFVLYVIDNASNDETIELLTEYKGSEIKLIQNTQNFGVAKGNNQGIAAGLEDNCDFILLINNDTVFEPLLLQKLVDAYIKYGSSIIAPKMMYHDSGNLIWFAGGFFNKKKAWLNYHRGQGEEDLGQYNTDDIIEYAPTCCTLIHKSVFEDIGLMDEKYFVYFDDTDFFYRVVKSGKHQTRYIHDVHFYHKIGSLTKSRNYNDKKQPERGSFFIKQMTCNQIYYLKKQKSFYAYIYIIRFIFRVQLVYLFNGKYPRNWSTFLLIQKSIMRGVFL